MSEQQKKTNENEKWVGVIRESGNLIAKMPAFVQHCVGISFICFSCMLACLVAGGLATVIYYIWQKLNHF